MHTVVSCMTLGKTHEASEPQLPRVWNGNVRLERLSGGALVCTMSEIGSRHQRGEEEEEEYRWGWSIAIDCLLPATGPGVDSPALHKPGMEADACNPSTQNVKA